MKEERIARYVELKAIEKEVAAELDAIKKEIYEVGEDAFEVGQYTVKVTQQTRMDFNKDNVAKLIEQAVDAGLISKENIETDYIKSTTFKVVRVK